MLAREAFLHVAVLELPARWNEPAVVLAETDRLLRARPAPDLALLPEAALTGYVSPERDFDLAPYAETRTGPSAIALGALARTHRCYLGGPLVERDGDEVYNAFLVFAPDGTPIAHYRKRHPWYPETWATPGRAPPPVFDVAGLRVTLAVCFDAQFLADDAARELEEADVLLFPSAWVERDDSRGVLLGGLARRFGVAVVNANWGEGAPRVPGQGGSRILGRDGEVLAMARGPGRLDAHVARVTST
ncbi:MAG TPA: carbon-nitrogen hydrolase family protein [Polyangiaceae bacterium]|nr:carbon-nitrogen hydrolase family protein [Polyangiaceae bacterium]